MEFHRFTATLQVIFRMIGNFLKKHFDDCNVLPSMDIVKDLGRSILNRLFALESSFIS